PTTPYIYTLSLHDALPIYMNTLVDDLSIFIDAGYLSAQGYEGVEYKTGHNGTGRAIDHILFTPNFKIENVGVIDSQESSDHKILDRKSTRLNSSHVSISYA